MSDISDKLKNRILKLYNLATQGFGGEKDNAKRILDNLLLSHGINLSQIIDNEELAVFSVTYKSKLEQRLLQQIIFKIRNGERTKGYSENKKQIFQATKIEGAEIIAAYEIYRKALIEEIEDIFTAFIHKQNIFPDRKPNDNDNTQLSAEEMEKSRKIIGMMDGINKVNIHKMVEVINNG